MPFKLRAISSYVYNKTIGWLTCNRQPEVKSMTQERLREIISALKSSATQSQVVLDLKQNVDAAFTDKIKLRDLIKLVEIALFENLDQGEKDYIYKSSKNTSFNYFYPSYSFSTSLLDHDVLKRLYENPESKILSVGSAESYLERLLIEINAVKKDNIIVSDIDTGSLPADLRHVSFSMLDKWPTFDQGFDLIIFPESALVISDQQGTVIDYNWIPPNPEIIGDADWLKYLTIATKSLFHVLNESLKNLKTEGQIRMTSCVFGSDIVEFVEEKLKKAGHDVNITLHPDHAGLLLVDKF